MKTFSWIIILIAIIPCQYSCGTSEKDHNNKRSTTIHAVTDLAHEFSFYADGRFYSQYMPDQKGVTNWCSLSNFDFSNANLLILLGSDNRLEYSPEDIETIKNFLQAGGGVLLFGDTESTSQNALLSQFGGEFSTPATLPLRISSKLDQKNVDGKQASALELDSTRKWEVLIEDSNDRAVMARRKFGKGILLASSRYLAGNHPSAKDSINKKMWRSLLPELVSGKQIDENKPFNGCGIEDLEHHVDHGGFKLSYNDYLEPYANAMVAVYKKALPFIEKRMGVPLSPGMASHITLLATGGGGFSSGSTIGLAVWWGNFPEKEDSMVEFLTHESVHSWVLPFPEVWNEPIATYVGNLVMMDMGYKNEGLTRIQKTIDRARLHDPGMNLYDLQGNLTGEGKELDNASKNNIHWGKTFWILEQLRKENPDFIAEYFQLKRKYARPDKITHYDMNTTVALLSKVMDKDLFHWFNLHGIPVEKDQSEIELP